MRTMHHLDSVIERIVIGPASITR
jgi:hypothetical protein